MKAPGLKPKVFGKNSTQYQARLGTYYSANAALEPWCMVLPTSTEDVAQIAKVISQKGMPFWHQEWRPLGLCWVERSEGWHHHRLRYAPCSCLSRVVIH
jgi:hypothetical protein